MNNRFVFIVPAFNASETIFRSIMSVWFQTHTNWKIIIRDDLSTDNTPEIIDQTKRQLQLGDDKISLTVNTEKHWEVKNIIESLKECESNDIICRLDGDDWLCDCDALSIINHHYNTGNYGALWTSHRWSFSNHNISAPLPKDSNPYTHPWVSSHLKTFRKKLIEGVKDTNFRDEDGEYFKRIGDQTVYLPVLHQAAGNWHYEPIVAYHYTIDMNTSTFQTEDAKFQRDEGLYLRQRGFLK
jgi:glycosyltransferase involved in cell wall biosynthesis